MISELLSQTIQKNHNRTYLVDVASEKELTYDKLEKQALSFSKAIAKKTKPGDTIGFMVSDALLVTPALLGCWIANVIPTILDPKLPADRFRVMNSILQVSTLITDLPKVEYRLIPQINLNQVPTEDDPSTPLTFKLHESKSPCLILFSSGTTGVPKCIPLSLANIVSNVIAFNETLGINSTDIFLSASPLWYAHGLYNSLLTTLFLGTKVVYGGVLNVMNTEKILAMGVKHQTTIFHVTPSMLPILTLIAQRTQKPLPPLRQIICGTAKLQMHDKEKFESVFATPITQQYGMTETLFMAVNSKYQQKKPESVGTQVGCTLQIRDDEGNILPPGVSGNVIVKSKASFGSYYHQPEETKQAYQEGWFHTEDLGILDQDHCLIITGRKKEMIKKGGFNIGPNEIDATLLRLQGVLETATVGVPDRLYGEEIYTFVVLGLPLTEQELLQHCKKNLPNTHIPRKIIVLPKLPKTESGKIKKQELKSLVNQFNELS